MFVNRCKILYLLSTMIYVKVQPSNQKIHLSICHSLFTPFTKFLMKSENPLQNSIVGDDRYLLQRIIVGNTGLWSRSVFLHLYSCNDKSLLVYDKNITFLCSPQSAHTLYILLHFIHWIWNTTRDEITVWKLTCCRVRESLPPYLRDIAAPVSSIHV